MIVTMPDAITLADLHRFASNHGLIVKSDGPHRLQLVRAGAPHPMQHYRDTLEQIRKEQE